MTQRVVVDFREGRRWAGATGVTSGSLVYSNETSLIVYGLRFASQDRAIYLDNCTDVWIVGCDFDTVGSAVVAHRCTNVRVLACTATDIMSGNFVQYDKCQGGRVAGNRVVNNTGSDPEDIISMFQSNGRSGDPILIENNVLRGGGPSLSGSGIMLGDNGGSYQIARRNKLIDTGQVGIGIAGGTDHHVVDNTVVGSQRDNSNVGIYALDYAQEGWGEHRVARNRVHWIKSDGTANHRYFPDPVELTGNRWGDASLVGYVA